MPQEETPPPILSIPLHPSPPSPPSPPVTIRKHLGKPEGFLGALPPPSFMRVGGTVQTLVVFLTAERTYGAACLRVMGCGGAAEAPRSDCEQLRGCESSGEKGCSHSCHPPPTLNPPPNTQGTAIRRRSVTLGLMILLPTLNYGSSREPRGDASDVSAEFRACRESQNH